MTAISRRAVLAGTLASACSRSEAQPRPRARRLQFTGVNLAGLEFQGARLPGRLNTDFVAPSEAEFSYYARCGANLVRVPFLWERLQPTLGAAFAQPYLDVLDAVVRQARAHRLHIVLDAHQYGRRTDSGDVRLIGEDRETLQGFASLWGALASRYADQPHVIFGLVNEPHDEPNALVLSTQNAAIAAIRAADARHLIFVDGPGWSGAHAWNNSGAAEVMRGIHDPADNFAFDVHQYLDSNSSGTHPQCIPGSAQRLRDFSQWARANNARGFLGEFGVGDSPACLQELDSLLNLVNANADVWLGWAYWAGGAWWGASYPLSVEPADFEGPDRPQMSVLRRHFVRNS